MVAPWHNLSAKVKADAAGHSNLFEAAHGKDIWSYAAANPAFNTLFNEGLDCNARVVTLPAILGSCRDMFNGVGSLVDVGGGNGTTLSVLVKACPWMKGINFDLPNVVSTSQEYEGVQHVGGSMFDYVPKADAAFFMVSIACSYVCNSSSLPLVDIVLLLLFLSSFPSRFLK